MAKPLLPDELWAQVEPLLPRPKRRRFRHPGRKPLDRRKVLTGILFVLRTGIRWNDLPAEVGCGSGSRCRRYLKAWHRAGVWKRLHERLLAELDDARAIDWSRAAVDSASARALGGGTKTGPNPTDRGRPGSKHHAVVDPQSIPLGATTTAANTPDVMGLPEVIDAAPAVRGVADDEPNGGPSGSTPTGPMTASHTADGCAGGRSTRSSLAGGPNTAAGWASTAGWWSGSSPGCTATDD